MPKVSIIIPTYNAEKFINETIQSVIDQTYTNWELIIVDDLSKDNTRKILEEWKNKNDKIQLIFLDVNSGGPAHPKNIGMLKATGKYIAYLDHDDIWMPKKIEKQIDILENDSEIGLISCEAISIDKQGHFLDKALIKNIPNHGVFPEIFYTDFIISNSSLVIPKSVIDKLGNRDENPKIGIAEDREIELRIATAGYKLYVIHESLFKYRFHGNNASKNGSPLSYAESNLKYITEYKKYNLEYLIYERFMREYIKLNDIDNAKKYCKLSLSGNKNIVLILTCIFLSFGKFSLNLFRKILKLRTKLIYK